MVKRTLLVIFFLLNIISGFAQYNWQALSNAPKSWRCDDIYFLNPQMGWVISAYYDSCDYSTPHKFGQIWKTRDGGNAWQLMKDSSLTYYRCVGFTDSLNGWVGNLADNRIYSCGQATPDTIPLYHTTDGGITWSPVTGIPSPTPKGICGISIVNDSVIYAYGRFFGPPVLIKTTNKGATWTSYDMSAYASVGLIDGWFWSKDTGFVTGQNGNNAVILHTNDGGVTWQTVYQATRNDSDHVWKIFFPSRNIGYGSIEYLGNMRTFNTYFVKTTDGGQTWTEHAFVGSYDEEGCGFINDSTGWIGGDFCKPNYITFDGGNSWVPDNGFGVSTPPYAFCNSGFSINRFRKFGDSLMYASGNTSYKLSGTITRMDNVNNTAASNLTNHPNPFSTQTIIEYTLPQTCHNVKIKVFNSSSKLLLSKDLGTQNSGKHSVVYQNENSSGMLYYTLTSDEYSATEKMIVTK